MVYLDLTFNLTLLVALSIISGFVEKRWSRHTLPGLLLQGLLFGVAAILGMLRPLNLGPGLIFDGRSLMVSLCALFFGPWAGAVAGALTLSCRIWLGGTGVITGSLVILSSAAIGIFVHYRFKPELKPPSAGSLYLFGLAVHLAMLALMFTLPGGAGLTVVMRIGLPVIILYPLATILAGKILSDQIAAEQARKALSDSRATLSLILDTVPQSIFWKDLEGRYLGCNKVFAVSAGLNDPALIIGKNDYDLPWLREEVEAYRADDREVLVNNRPKLHIIEQLRQAGENRIWIDTSKVPLRNENGIPFAVLGVFEDITERRQADNMLRESEEKHRRIANEQQIILQNSPVGICLIKDRKIFWANSAFDTMFGLEPGTAHNLETCEFYSTRQLYEDTGREAYRLLTGGTSYTDDVLMRKKDGALFWCNITGHAVMQGNPEEGSIWIIQDISKRKQSEEQMLSLTQRLQLATSSARLGVWDWNIRDNTMVWDDRMFELYGITPATLPISIDAWMNGLHPEDRKRAFAECQAALNGEKEFDPVFRVLHPDGTVKHIKANGLVIRGADGTAERMIGINADVSGQIQAGEEKARLEGQLLHAHKMESVGRLAGGVAHDFNNMLGVILGHAELGLMHLDPAHRVCADLEEISKAAERSADLTRQLLAFASQQIIAPKVLDLNENVTAMLKMLQRLIGEDIKLSWHPAPDLWQISMDPSQIDQILANLCVNARDAIEDTGRISIETENITADRDFCSNNPDATPGEYVRLTVSDNGKGMDRETVSHVFEPFYTTKELGKGTGLGLATVYGAVKQNSGFVNIYSEPGLGTTLSIYIPRHEGTCTQSQTEEPVAPAPCGRETILLVEDEPAILNITSQMLGKLGYSVLQAVTPGKAMQVAREQAGKIHLLMTDVIMPEMNGRDLAKILQSIHPEMKRLFMSGYTADVIAHHGVLEDEVHFIQKPFSLPVMAAKVREVLDENTPNSR